MEKIIVISIFIRNERIVTRSVTEYRIISTSGIMIRGYNNKYDETIEVDKRYTVKTSNALVKDMVFFWVEKGEYWSAFNNH